MDCAGGYFGSGGCDGETMFRAESRRGRWVLGFFAGLNGLSL